MLTTKLNRIFKTVFAVLIFVWFYNFFPTATTSDVAVFGVREAQAAVSFKTGSFQKATSTGNQAVSGVGFQPKAMIFFWTNQTSTVGGFRASLSMGMGFATSSGMELGVAIASNDNIATTDAGRRRSDSNMIILLSSGAPTLEAQAGLTSMDTDGFTVNWGTNNTATTTIKYIALGGADITNATVGTSSIGIATGSQSFTNVGFQPDFMMFMNAGGTSLAVDTNGLGLVFGIGFAASSTQQGTIEIGERDARTTPTTGVWLSTTSSTNLYTDKPTIDGTMALTSFNANGFTLNVNDAPAAATPLYWLALKGGRYFVRNFNAASSTGNKSYTGVGFTPVGLTMFSHGQATTSNYVTNENGVASVSFGAADSPSSQQSIWGQTDDGAVVQNSDANVFSTSSQIMVLAQSATSTVATTTALASLSSFDTDGFTLNWSKVTSTQSMIVYWAIGSTPVPTSTYEQSAYKWYANNNSSTVGAELTTGLQDASTTLSAAGAAFRLHTLLHVSVATSTAGTDTFKLQYASTTPGNCGPAFYSSSAFVDATSTTGEIRFNDNALPADGDPYVSTSTDPTHGGDVRVDQTYEEAGNFTVTSTIIATRDGRWDFSLVDAAAPANTTYCFRVVKSDNSFIATSTSSKIPEIKTAQGGPTTITLANGTQPAGVTIGPGANATTTAVFTFTTDFGTSTITQASTTVSTSTGVYQIQITNDSASTVFGSSTNPTTNSSTISLSGMNVSSSATTFRILIKPLNATSMPSTPISGSGAVGGTYVVTSTVADWVDSKSLAKSGANTTSSPVTIDNLSPADATSVSGSAGNGQVSFSWTNPVDSDFATTTILRATSSISVRPTEGTYYAIGQTLNATTTVACVASSAVTACTDTGLTNGTTYYYMLFAADNYLNYSSGTVPSGNPFTPAANSAPTVSTVVLNGGSAITLTPNATTAISLSAQVSDTDGCSDITGGTTTAMIYRSGITSSTCQGGANNQYCYVATAFTASSTCSAGSVNTTTTFGVWYFAQPTTVSSSYESQNWKGTVIFKDPQNATGSADSAGVELEILLALQVTTSSINYGTINASSTTSSTNQFATTTNVGNTTTTYKIRAQSTLTKSGDSIATSSQRWAVSAFNMDNLSPGTSTALSDSFTLVSDHIMAAATTTLGVAGLRTFWGLQVPASAPPGTYSGVTEFVSVWSAADSWWNASWLNRRKITFDNSTSTENLTDFPVLVSLNSSRIDYAKTLNLGEDIRFVDRDGITALNYEIERWDETATSTVWVKIPKIDSNSTTDYIWMYYNNTGASDNSTTTGVWDANFRLVSHFGSLDANATDSTSNLNHGTVTGATATTTDAVAGYGKDFDGANDLVDFGSGSSVDDLISRTISLWVRPDVLNPANKSTLFQKSATSSGAQTDYNLHILDYNNNGIGYGANFSTLDGLWESANGNGTALTHVALTYNRTAAANDPIVYVNGTALSWAVDANPTGSAESDAAFNIRVGDSESGTMDLDGRVDEVRYSNSIRSADWIRAEWKNGADTYSTFGGEETKP